MPKYHVKKDGTPGVCHAKEGNCPLGGSENHFETQEEAYEHGQKQLEKEFGVVETAKEKAAGPELITKELLKQNAMGLTSMGINTSIIDDGDTVTVLSGDNKMTYVRIEGTDNFELKN